MEFEEVGVGFVRYGMIAVFGKKEIVDSLEDGVDISGNGKYHR